MSLIDDFIKLKHEHKPFVNFFTAPPWVFAWLRANLPNDDSPVGIDAIPIKVSNNLSEHVVAYYTDDSYKVIHVGKGP